ncbi:MAG: tetratricopeptide repeat protein [Ignavibacteriota bacterium]|nr:tetratricopeptide repeat protein [Ignavibacteriota bacterium]
MKSLKVFLGLIFFIGAISIYLGGCSPAETTTGKLAYGQKDWEKAASELAKGLAVDKTDAEAWYMLGYAQTELGKFTEAAVSFKEASTRSADYGNLIKNYWIDKFNAGINDFNSGVKSLGKKETDNANAYFGKAVKNFTAATGIIPDSIAAHQLLADSYNYMGQTDKALEIYQNILDKSKSKEDAIQIGKLMYAAGIKARQAEDYVKAFSIFKRVLTIPYIPKDNIYYESSQFNCGYCNYQLAVKLATDGKAKAEYEPFLNETVKYIEGVTSTSKSKELLKDSYEILINAYDALGNNAKKEEAVQKKAALN